MKIINYTVIVILTLLLLPCKFVSTQGTRYLPKILPKAPNISSLLRFGVYDVNLIRKYKHITI